MNGRSVKVVVEMYKTYSFFEGMEYDSENTVMVFGAE